MKELAAYLIKETQKSFRKKDNPNKLAYSRSRNLKKPVVKTKGYQGEHLEERTGAACWVYDPARRYRDRN